MSKKLFIPKNDEPVTCYTEKETLFLLDCIDFVIDNDTEFIENTVIEENAHHTPMFQLREKVFQNLLKMQEAV